MNRIPIGLISIFAIVWAGQFGLSGVPVNWWIWSACLIFAVGSLYWMHRIAYHAPILEALNSVQNSPDNSDKNAASQFISLIEMSIISHGLPMILLGFSGPHVLLCMLVAFAILMWFNIEIIGSIGRFGKAQIAPQFNEFCCDSEVRNLGRNDVGFISTRDQIVARNLADVKMVKSNLTPENVSEKPSSQEGENSKFCGRIRWGEMTDRNVPSCSSNLWNRTEIENRHLIRNQNEKFGSILKHLGRIHLELLQDVLSARFSVAELTLDAKKMSAFKPNYQNVWI